MLYPILTIWATANLAACLWLVVKVAKEPMDD